MEVVFTVVVWGLIVWLASAWVLHFRNKRRNNSVNN